MRSVISLTDVAKGFDIAVISAALSKGGNQKLITAFGVLLLPVLIGFATLHTGMRNYVR